ncbi:MAG TPA: hypothetical protein VES39_12060, partial [Rhodospirillales bacterium]|nr:hypothetical protein [Rhodospirillales bacterium]
AAEREVISTMQAAAERMMPGQALGGSVEASDVALVSQTSEPVASEEAAKAVAPPEGALALAEDQAEAVSQTSEAVVEATAAAAEGAAAAGSTAAAAEAAAKPTRKAGPRAKRILPPGA